MWGWKGGLLVIKETIFGVSRREGRVGRSMKNMKQDDELQALGGTIISWKQFNVYQSSVLHQ